MKNMKKLLSILVLCVIVCVALVVTSCGGGGNDGGQSQTNTNTNTNTQTNTSTNTETSTDTDTDEAEEVYYYVYVVDQAGNPIEGVEVQICKGGLCLRPQITDANGRAKFVYGQKDEFSAQINSVPDGCISPNPSESEADKVKFPFPTDSTTVKIEIERLQKYNVTASDMHGEKLANILVELFDAETNELVESAITGKDGRVSFEVAPSEYYAMVKHAYGNSAFTLASSDDGKISFEKSRNAQVSFVVLNTSIDYKVELGALGNGATLKLLNKDFNLVDTKTADQDGVATFTVPNGTYYVVSELEGCYIKPVIFEKNGKVSESTEVYQGKGGDKDHPIYVLGSIDVTIEASEELYIFVPNADGQNIKFETETLKVRCLERAKNFTPSNGVIDVDLLATDGGALLKVTTSKTEGTDTVKGVVYEPGSLKTPYELDINEAKNGMTVSVSENGRVYYTFVATIDGTITATTETENAVVSINGNPFKKSVKAGDTVVICFYTEFDNGTTVEHPEAEIEASFDYRLIEDASYKVTTIVEANVASVEIELYKKVGDAYEKVATATTSAEGIFVFENLTQTADYYVKAICPDGYETQVEYTAFGDENEIDVYVNHVRDGSQRYPYLIDSEESNASTTEVTLTSDGVWYTLFYIQGAQISCDNANATVEIYTLTSADGTPTLVTTITDPAVIYTLGDDLGTNARVLVLVKGESGTAGLTIVFPEIEEE